MSVVIASEALKNGGVSIETPNGGTIHISWSSTRESVEVEFMSKDKLNLYGGGNIRFKGSKM